MSTSRETPCIFFPWRDTPQGALASSCTMFLDHTQRHTTVGRTPLDEWSARRRNLYLTTHTTDRHPCPRWDSNPWSQQASGRRPTPYIARSLGPGLFYITLALITGFKHNGQSSLPVRIIFLYKFWIFDRLFYQYRETCLKRNLYIAETCL